MERTDGIDVVECERCPALVDCRSRIVNGHGPVDADVALVGEAPGANEDREGRPFVGRSGDVLDEALGAAGIPRETVRIINCVRCRPPDNRDPHEEELANCRPYLDAEVDAVDPEALVTLGKVPAEHLLDRSVGVTDEAGEVYDARIAGAPRRVVVSVHPAATLYDPSQREALDRALERAADLAGESESGQSRLGEF
ncbi:uracil-DNA glycosylase [Halobacteriales archaeon QS_8_69_26]|nr:MAG: uracil-DNA glycosylase [Halobacteriales archaeon QS_8_69_26]